MWKICVCVLLRLMNFQILMILCGNPLGVIDALSYFNLLHSRNVERVVNRQPGHRARTPRANPTTEDLVSLRGICSAGCPCGNQVDDLSHAYIGNTLLNALALFLDTFNHWWIFRDIF